MPSLPVIFLTLLLEACMAFALLFFVRMRKKAHNPLEYTEYTLWVLYMIFVAFALFASNTPAERYIQDALLFVFGFTAITVLTALLRGVAHAFGRYEFIVFPIISILFYVWYRNAALDQFHARFGLLAFGAGVLLGYLEERYQKKNETV